MTKLRGAQIGFLVLLAAFMIWLVYANIDTLGSWQRQQSLSSSGVVTTGRVVDAQQSIHGRNSSYSVTYRFEAEGTTRTVTEQVTFDVFDNAKLLNTVDVRYVRGNPAISRIQDNADPQVNIASVLIFDVVTVAVVAFVIWGIRKPKRPPGP